MKKLTILLAVFAFATTVSLGARNAAKPHLSQPIYGEKLASADVDRLLNAAAKYSRYHKPWMKRPVVDIVPVAKWREEVCGDAEFDCGTLGYTSSGERDIVHVVAVIPPDAVKKLGWTRDEIIVHELVHWLQIQADPKRMQTTKCAEIDATETEAYAAQFAYAVDELHLDHFFWKPDIYGGCIITKMMKRGHH